MEDWSLYLAYLLLKVEICKINLERYILIRKQVGLAKPACRLNLSIDREGVEIFQFQYWWKLLYYMIQSSWFWSAWTNLKSFCKTWHKQLKRLYKYVRYIKTMNNLFPIFTFLQNTVILNTWHSFKTIKMNYA